MAYVLEKPDEYKDKAVEYLMEAAHQGGLAAPVSSAVGTALMEQGVRFDPQAALYKLTEPKSELDPAHARDDS